jgi:hypothetical protein
MTKKRTRHIPTAVQQAVNTRHFFECAWCGVNITEQHHLDEFHLGGEHVEENLILLCPTHHAMAHKGEILKSELVARKSNHQKGDRLSGNFKTTLDRSRVVIGNSLFIDCSYFFHYNGFPIFDLKVENGNLLVYSRFYDPWGNLIFWMARNMFWTTVDTKVSSPTIDFVEISNPDRYFFLRIQRQNNHLLIYLETYIDGLRVVADSQRILFSNGMGYFNYESNVSVNSDWIFNLAPPEGHDLDHSF